VLPLDELGRHGWVTRYRAGRPPPEIERAKLIVGERLDRPDVMGEWRRYRARHRLIYELDDDVWTVDPTNTMAWKCYSIHSVQDAVETLSAMSDLVTVSTEPLAEVVRRRTGQSCVRVLKNCIPQEMLLIERPRRENLTIGWTGGGSHALDVAQIATAVRRAMDTLPDARLHILGTDFRPTFGHMHARHTKWVPIQRDYYRLLDFDIGLAPIVTSEFNESKSYLKALEYAALGIPVVASDFGPYKEFVVDGVTGFLVSKKGQWTDRIRLLATDADLRESMGQKAREVAAQHTIERNWHEWATVYQEALS
jgi:glycosyltransferase involved in cell wall biosynthesis